MAAARAKTEGMIRVPGDDAKPEDVAAFRKALGVPDDPTGYGLVKPETLPMAFLGMTHTPLSLARRPMNWG